MKKLVLMFLTLVMCISLCACGGGKETPPTTESTTEAPAESTQSEKLEESSGAVSETTIANTTKNYIDDDEFFSYFELIELTVDNYKDYVDIDFGESVDAFGDPTVKEEAEVKMKDGYVALSDTIVKFKYTVETYNGSIKEKEKDLELDYCDYWRKIRDAEGKITSVEATKAKGIIFKVNIPEEAWKTSSNGVVYLVHGEEGNTKSINYNSWPRYQKFLEEEMVKRGMSLTGNVSSKDVSEQKEPEEQKEIIAVELTAENFNEYFELIEEFDIKKNAFDEIDDVTVITNFVLKPEYQEKFVIEKDYISSYAVEYLNTNLLYEGSLDYINETYVLEKNLLNDLDKSQLKRTDMKNIELDEANTACEVAAFRFDEPKQGEKEGELKGDAMGFKFEEIIRVKGTLYLYK